MNMTNQAGTAVVKHLPETLSMKQQRLFFAEAESCFNVDRPCIVLDCSKLRKVDRSVIHLLLCCLEEAMKRNGDVKLAAISDEVAALLEVTGADRLFEVFDTSAEAMISFRQLNVGAGMNLHMSGKLRPGSYNAALPPLKVDSEALSISGRGGNQ
jgi:anti-anti-sigma factor